MITYKTLQRELKQLRKDGHQLTVFLNAKKEDLLREYERLTEQLIETPSEVDITETQQTFEDDSVDEQTNTYIQSRALYLFPLIEKLALIDRPNLRRDGTSNLPGWKKLALQETVNLKDYYPDNIDSRGNIKPLADRRYHTAWNQNNKLKHELFRLINSSHLQDKALLKPMLNVTTKISNEIASRLMEYKMKSNHEYKRKVDERKKPANRIEIDLTTILKRANEILSYVNQCHQTKTIISRKVNWRDVSCAIALTTGRRMSEIHQSGNFEYKSDYELLFSGQLKGKERTVDNSKLYDHVFSIPTLVKAEYIIAGMVYLSTSNKRIYKNLPTVKVNELYSKALSKAVTDNWSIYEPLYDRYLTLIDKQTYHRFRAFYFVACSENYRLEHKGDLVDSANYASQIMGDRDMTVLESYQRYTIKNNSITRI